MAVSRLVALSALLCITLLAIAFLIASLIATCALVGAALCLFLAASVLALAFLIVAA